MQPRQDAAGQGPVLTLLQPNAGVGRTGREVPASTHDRQAGTGLQSGRSGMHRAELCPCGTSNEEKSFLVLAALETVILSWPQTVGVRLVERPWPGEWPQATDRQGLVRETELLSGEPLMSRSRSREQEAGAPGQSR